MDLYAKFRKSSLIRGCSAFNFTPNLNPNRWSPIHFFVNSFKRSVMPRIVAVDYGLKRIGLAISDDKGRIALPLKLALCAKSLKQTVTNVLSALSPFDGQIETIVVGLPLHLDGSKSEMSEAAERFAQALQNETKITVTMMDERLSTAQAERSLKECSYSRKQRTNIIDSASAAILLQTFLDKKHESP
jgi:putative Holliday junction resolvase